jgi:DUF4097 and DUF4098 domain-containing protein YvlB
MKYLLLLLVVSYHTATAQYPTDNDPYLTKSLSADNIQKVKVETSGGSISVSGVPASEARIEVFIWQGNRRKTDRPSKEEIKKILDENYDMDISVAGNKLTATAKRKRNGDRWDNSNSLSISFKVYVPKNVSTDLLTSGGSISLSDLNGTQDFTTSGGSLHVDKLSGHTTGTTSGGSIYVSNSKDDIDLTTSGGSIEAKNSSGNIKLTTSGGSLHLSELKGDIKATTSGGSVHGNTIQGALIASTSGGSVILKELSCSVDASTSGGNISVNIKELGAYVKISNSSGNIDLQLPGGKGLDLKLTADKIRTSSLTNFSGKVEDDRIEGKLNNGGVPVTVRGGSGRLSLSFQ